MTGDQANASKRTPSNATVRPATLDDLPRLTGIYNHYIVSTPITFDLEPFSIEQRREWFSHYAATGPHRLLVAEDAGAVLGYTTSSKFHPRRVYDTTVEMTVLSAPEAIGRGEDVHRAVAAITLPNDASCGLHERFGFRRVGELREVRRKFGEYWDVVWYEKQL